MRRVGGAVVIRVGDRVRWVAPEDAHRYLTPLRLPLSGEDIVVPWTIPQPQPGGYVQLAKLGLGISVTWCTLADEPAVPAVPVPRTPDRACRWCHGTGAVQLVFSSAPCDCIGGGT